MSVQGGKEEEKTVSRNVTIMNGYNLNLTECKIASIYRNKDTILWLNAYVTIYVALFQEDRKNRWDRIKYEWTRISGATTVKWF